MAVRIFFFISALLPYLPCCNFLYLYNEIVSMMDVLAHKTMKGAANCGKHCELQNSVNQLDIDLLACGKRLLACLL